jgi:cytochrome c553
MKISASFLTRVLTVAGAVGLAAGTGAICSSNVSSVQAQPADEYTNVVKPIFVASCTKCHNSVKARGGLNLETRDGILKGGVMDGKPNVVVVPGHPEQSLLVALIKHEGPKDDPMPMPPPPHDKLSDADIAAVSKWIQDGAVIPQ